MLDNVLPAPLYAGQVEGFERRASHNKIYPLDVASLNQRQSPREYRKGLLICETEESRCVKEMVCFRVHSPSCALELKAWRTGES